MAGAGSRGGLFQRGGLAAGGGLAALALTLLGCSATRPESPNNLCSIFTERPHWYEAARDSHEKWGVSVPLQLAVIHHESGFDSNARPPRKTFLWIFPGARLSSAYGYGQVLDGTWDHYRESTGASWADRDDFADVTDFIGWYGHWGTTKHGISRSDPYSFYLSYHEGHHGFRRGTHRSKPGARTAARRVSTLARRYTSQYRACREELDDMVDGPWWWPF